jgi:hypothetical protein
MLSKLEGLTEVMAAHKWIIRHGIGAAGGQDSPLGEDVGTICDRQGFAHVVVSNQHTHATVAKAIDQGLKIGYRHRVDPGEGPIQQQVAGPISTDRQGAGYLTTPPLTAGELETLAVLKRNKVEIHD